MTEDVIKHLVSGNRIVKINTDFDYFGDGTTMQEKWLTIDEINTKRTIFFCKS